MPPKVVEQILGSCEQQIARFQQANNTGLIEIQCSLSQGHYKVECRCGDFQNFLISPKDLAVWKTTPLSRQREDLKTVEQVLAKLDSALFETFCLQQGYATIVIRHRGHDSRYGFEFSPSIIHGIKRC
ncbi:hypothetical protein [Tolypothrix sp. VBCCA 56010]|uniref:hypothetical protein n=1 Tax=Tolypothrix sp. VBCCA 56010 TaxID=3137731 RepID=UPI003D7DF1D3